MADSPRPHEAAHPTPFTYLKVAAALGALTAIEVGVFYVDVLEPVFLPIFLILSVVKFALVVMFYMHLKFDSRLFSWVFVGGLLLAIVVGVALMSLFQVLSATSDRPVVVEAGGAPEVEVVETGGPSGSETTEVLDPVALGEAIYLEVPANVGTQALWCYQCHKIEGVAAGLIGPDHTNLGTEASTRVTGLSAEEYIRESIVDPEKRVAEGVERATAGLMTNAITQNLTADQVDALVAFLLAQE